VISEEEKKKVRKSFWASEIKGAKWELELEGETILVRED